MLRNQVSPGFRLLSGKAEPVPGPEGEDGRNIASGGFHACPRFGFCFQANQKMDKINRPGDSLQIMAFARCMLGEWGPSGSLPDLNRIVHGMRCNDGSRLRNGWFRNPPFSAGFGFFLLQSRYQALQVAARFSQKPFPCRVQIIEDWIFHGLLPPRNSAGVQINMPPNPSLASRR